MAENKKRETMTKKSKIGVQEMGAVSGGIEGFGDSNKKARYKAYCKVCFLEPTDGSRLNPLPFAQWIERGEPEGPCGLETHI